MTRHELRDLVLRVRDVAKRYGLDFFETRFQVVDFETMNELVAYGGFPGRYRHWRFGMEYERLKKSYAYGLHKVYELVVNNDPAYAYLLQSNSPVEHKMVIAHVYAHVDFFKNNQWFAHTNRRMLDEMANHAETVRRYIDEYGLDTVEAFLDRCLSISNLVDVHAPYVKRRPEKTDEEKGRRTGQSRRFRTKKYLDPYINPVTDTAEEKAHDKVVEPDKIPEEPQRDVLLFLLEYAPLKKWQRNLMAIVREEAYYFAPQAMTKILNEGWATFWHSRMLTESLLTDSEVIDYADQHSATVASEPHMLNPYALGLALLRDIEERWNRGRFGKEWEECQDMEERERWDRHLGLGMEKLFQVRRIYNDVMFIDEFLTPEFAQEHKLFVYELDNEGKARISTRDFKKVKERLLMSLTNIGEPLIDVTDGNYHNRGELYLVHRYEGVPLRRDWAIETLKNLAVLWSRPVNLETVVDDKKVVMSHDGSQFNLSKA